MNIRAALVGVVYGLLVATPICLVLWYIILPAMVKP